MKWRPDALGEREREGKKGGGGGSREEEGKEEQLNH